MRIRPFRALLVVALATIPVVTVAAPTALAGAAPGAVLVTVDQEEEACQLAHLNLTTVAVTPFGPSSLDHCAVDLAFAADGSLYGAVPAEFFAPEPDQPEIESEAVTAFFGDVGVQAIVPWNLVRYDT